MDFTSFYFINYEEFIMLHMHFYALIYYDFTCIFLIKFINNFEKMNWNLKLIGEYAFMHKFPNYQKLVQFGF